jgi:cyclopropane-fatty-acyl-phospholipid synthase
LKPEALWQGFNPEQPNVGNWLAANYPPRFMRRLLLAAKMKQDHLLGISEHYDVSNDFYKLFLDKKYMFYSCADFHSPDESLEEAQTNKAEFILKLIDPKPGEKLLDLGCGWGPMMKRVFEKTGDRENLYGYTLSQEQVDFVREQYGFNVEFRNFITCDYEKDAFDKIYSIGSWEHVRHPDLRPLVDKLYRALKPGGRMVKHFFTSFDEDLTNDAVIAQLFFPGSYQPSHALQVQAFEGAGFRITQRTIHDYRPTLRAWFDNLVSNTDEAIELVGLRTYNKYLVFFAASHNYFQRQGAALIRYVLEKPSK